LWRKKRGQKFYRGCGPAGRKNFVSKDWIHIIVWAVVIGGLFGVLWWQGQIQRLALYVAQTREELRKCNWPTAEELKGSTTLIIIMILMLGLYIYVIDQVLNAFFIRQ
jgi:preprotein translocase subunit SecE